MKLIFRGRFHRSNLVDLYSSHELRLRRFSLPGELSLEVLHQAIPELAIDDDILPTHSLLPTTSPVSSPLVALSDSDTLHIDRQSRMELQHTYQENFTQYLPYLIHRQRLLRDAPDEPEPTPDDTFHDDQLTIFNEAGSGPATLTRSLIMDRSTNKYDLKRDFVVVNELIKNTTHVFVDAESFALFKFLRARRKHRNLVILYDQQGNIKRLLNAREVRQSIGDNVVDHRNHIIPLENKLLGKGLPLFKVVVPYMLTFRKSVPFMLFKRYREIPAKPVASDADSDLYESYNFCSVYVKLFQYVRRYTFNFTPENASPFKVVAFQHSFRAFTDFEYRNTRFRVLGTAIMGAYLMTYNPYLKLAIVDQDAPALTDNLVEKGNVKLAGELQNPRPYPTNPLLAESDFGVTSPRHNKAYIPKELPPFGGFTDAMTYVKSTSIIPKKYSEAGKITLYQDASNTTEDPSSTLSVDLDSLVLTCVMMVMRENNLRSTAKNNTTGVGGRLNAMVTSPLLYSPGSSIL